MRKFSFILMATLIMLFQCTLVSADYRPVLRVGYTDVPGYISRGEDGYFRGFVYDYLESIAVYSGYKFEYFQNLPDECVKQMMMGNIDLVAALPDVENPPPGITKTSRALIFAPVGIVVRRWITPEENKNLRIGYVPQIYTYDEIKKSLDIYGRREGQDYTLVPFKDHIELISDYNEGKLDGYIDASVYHREERGRMAARLFTKRFTIGMRTKDRKICERIDRGAEEMLLVNPQIRDHLRAKFSYGAPLILTLDEKKYIAEHPVISAVASPGQKPYTYFEDGEAKGAIADIIHLMENDLGIKFDIHETKNSGELMNLITNGDVEAVADFYSDYNWGHMHNAVLSFPYLTINYVPVMRRDGTIKENPTIACARNHFYTHEYAEKNYPKEQIVYFDTIKECMNAVNTGVADMTFVKSITMQHDIEQGDYMNLYTNGSVIFSHKVSIAVSNKADPRLIQILNKEISHLGDGPVDEIITRNIFEIERSKGLKAYVAKNPLQAIGILTAILLSIIGGLLYVMRIRRQASDKIYSIAYHNHMNGLTNIKWFEEEAPRVIQKHKKYLKAGKLFIMVLSTRRIDLLKASLKQDVVSSGIRRLVEEVRAKNKWILADGISSGLTHLYVLGCLPDDMTLHEVAEKFARDTSVMVNQGYDIHMEYYFGLCTIPEESAVDIPHLMANADTAQVEAMEKGDYIGIYDEKLQQKRIKQKAIERLMQKALENEEFQIWLQPKYDIRTHSIIGAEALTRWQSPEIGFVMPGLFIDLFEKNGFILEFDYYVLDHVCRLQQRRLDEGRKIVPFSVNQSGLHIREPGYLDRLNEIIRKYDLPPGAIDLEITETAFVDFDTQEGRENSSSIIAGMKKLGFTVSMDDFCTGYSSIAMLQYLDMDVMKIDRAMLLASESTARGQKIMRQVVSLGQNLNMLVLCEGVETKEQEDLLLENGCCYAQGFLFGRPMPAEEYFAFADALEAKSA